MDQEIRNCLEAFLKVHTLLPSFLVWDDTILGEIARHVTVEPDKELMDLVIEDGGSVKSVEDLREMALRYPYPLHEKFPGPMARFLLYEIAEARQCGFLLNGKLSDNTNLRKI